ncbi:MAG: AbrB/MazE/SpoVT family DNA-binding domain-containing protein [Thermomicrobiales bacterium]|nr:AbrB/MazE/SpoVT family DNA-binding domain-containing protein [Thermomicrobiales bacterium]
MASYSTKVSAKGQVVIPTSVQHQLDMEDGVTLLIKLEGEHLVLERPQSWVATTRGSLVSHHPQLDPEALEELIEATALVEAFAKYGNVR